MKKTTISVYHSVYWGMYVGYHEWFSIEFYGARAKELQKKWDARISTLDKESREKQEKEKAERIKKLEDELLITPNSWFCNKRKFIENQIKEEKDKKISGIGDMEKYWESFGFISKLGGVLISTGDKTKIYEV